MYCFAYPPVSFSTPLHPLVSYVSSGNVMNGDSNNQPRINFRCSVSAGGDFSSGKDFGMASYSCHISETIAQVASSSATSTVVAAKSGVNTATGTNSGYMTEVRRN